MVIAELGKYERSEPQLSDGDCAAAAKRSAQRIYSRFARLLGFSSAMTTVRAPPASPRVLRSPIRPPRIIARVLPAISPLTRTDPPTTPIMATTAQVTSPHKDGPAEK